MHYLILFIINEVLFIIMLIKLVEWKLLIIGKNS
jgi:hypothetical protein